MSDETRVTEVRRCGGKEWDKDMMKDSEGEKERKHQGQGKFEKTKGGVGLRGQE